MADFLETSIESSREALTIIVLFLSTPQLIIIVTCKNFGEQLL